MKKFILLFFALCFIKTYAQEPDSLTFFNEVAFGSDFGASAPVIKKWQQNIKIFVLGESNPALVEELNKIIEDVQPLIGDIQITKAKDKNSANLLIFLGAGKSYLQIEPNASNLIANNVAINMMTADANNALTKGTILIETYRVTNKDAQKRLLRKQFTHALGLLKSSTLSENSILYKEWSTKTKYSDLDKQAIQMLYDARVKPGMDVKQVGKIFNPAAYPDPKTTTSTISKTTTTNKTTATNKKTGTKTPAKKPTTGAKKPASGSNTKKPTSGTKK